MKTNSEVAGRFTHASHPPNLRFTYFNARPAAPHSLRLCIRSTSHTHILFNTHSLHTHSNPHPLSIKCIQPRILPTSAIRHHSHSPSDPFNFPWALHMSRPLIQPQAHSPKPYTHTHTKSHSFRPAPTFTSIQLDLREPHIFAASNSFSSIQLHIRFTFKVK